jgi:hypothetical protein
MKTETLAVSLALCDDFVILNELATRLCADLTAYQNSRKKLTSRQVMVLNALLDAINKYKAANV